LVVFSNPLPLEFLCLAHKKPINVTFSIIFYPYPRLSLCLYKLHFTMSEIAAPVLPDHVKKPNEEEYKKSLEQVNTSIEKIQKQFVK
jgi:hypothetical protein